MLDNAHCLDHFLDLHLYLLVRLLYHFFISFFFDVARIALISSKGVFIKFFFASVS